MSRTKSKSRGSAAASADRAPLDEREVVRLMRGRPAVLDILGHALAWLLATGSALVLSGILSLMVATSVVPALSMSVLQVTGVTPEAPLMVQATMWGAPTLFLVLLALWLTMLALRAIWGLRRRIIDSLAKQLGTRRRHSADGRQTDEDEEDAR